MTQKSKKKRKKKNIRVLLKTLNLDTKTFELGSPFRSTVAQSQTIEDKCVLPRPRDWNENWLMGGGGSGWKKAANWQKKLANC